jgi:hypothetical protein
MLHCSIQLNYTSGRHLCQGIWLFLCIATWTKMGRSLFTRRILVQKAKRLVSKRFRFCWQKPLAGHARIYPQHAHRERSSRCISSMRGSRTSKRSLLDSAVPVSEEDSAAALSSFPVGNARLFACGGAEGKVWFGSRQNERSPIRGQLRRTCTGTLQQGQHSRAVTTPRGAQAAECQPCV